MRLLTREDGRVERVCEHDIGHTIDAPEQLKKSWREYWNWHTSSVLIPWKFDTDAHGTSIFSE